MKFGTDGWRAIIAEDFTFANVRYCTQGVADYAKRAGIASRGFVVGYDNRFASEDFAAAAAEVLAGNGVRVLLSSRAAPTPVISYGVVHQGAAGAIVITASHNPARWNGLKLRIADGSSAPAEVISEVEEHVSRAFDAGEVSRMPLDQAIDRGLVSYHDLDVAYFERAARFVDLDRLKRAGLKIVVDPMYGVGAGYLGRLLDGGKLSLEEINRERNPAFPGINPEPIAVNLEKLQATVRDRQADIGIAQDGDADRIGIVDENGLFLTQLQVFALLCHYLLEVRGERGAIVKTITTTSMIDRLGEIYGVPVIETPVGFRFVAPKITEENAIIGGEESGGYGFRGHVPERDSIPAALYFLDFMV
ncbi:MAG: phosphoglucomutase/phosphomannomutase family protein, partial [Dehalococcoidales bacterium]